MAVIDVAGFIADLKGHADEHGFHIHGERHFVETYSLRQMWELELHPEEACDSPVDLLFSLDVDPRALLGFEDAVLKEDRPHDEPPEGFRFEMHLTWTLPPLANAPDLLVLATDLAGIGGVELPVEVTAIDSIQSVTDAPQRSLSLVANVTVDLGDVMMLTFEDQVCDLLTRCKDISMFLVERAPSWLGTE